MGERASEPVTQQSVFLFQTDESTYKKVTLLLRVYAYSDSILSVDDDSWRIECRSDDISGTSLFSEEAEVR